MSYENIEFTYNTFCIGPQAGTYCFVNYTDLNNVLLQVKNSSAVLIRNYSFLPSDVFYTDLSNYPYNIIVDLKYIGPRGRASFFNGAMFYTMERVIVGKITLQDGSKKEYSNKCVIRKWVIDDDAFTLTLENTFYINSDDTSYFDSYTFSVQYQSLSFSASTTTHTEEIEILNTSGLIIGDVLQLGPSSDVDNLNDVERVYIHSIDNNTVYIRSFDGVTPTRYEYVIGDPITYIGDIFLISNPKPILSNNPGQVIEYGDGSTGPVTITTSNTIINVYGYVTSVETVEGVNYIAVNDGSLFSVGQEVLIHQTQDASYSNAGVFEFKIIESINVNILILTDTLQNTYYSGTFNALNSIVTQVVSTPNYTNLLVKINAGIISKKWDGYSGGIVSFKSNLSIAFEAGSEGVSVATYGFRGGGDNGGGVGDPGDPGEGFTGYGWLNNSDISNCLANGNGGGGGYGPSGYDGTAGGGGGNRIAGGNATDSDVPPALAIGGHVVGDDVPNTLFFGGGGGGGGDDGNLTQGVCSGGDGGGIIIIKGLSISAMYATADGQKGTDSGGSTGGTGGGGAGGVIFIEASTYFEDSVSSIGGVAGIHASDIAGAGGAGYKLTPSTASNLVFTGYVDNGNVYRLDQKNYCTVIDFNESAKYTNVQASVWNITTGGLSLVKVNNYMTVDVEDGYENIKAQVIKTITKDFEEVYVYAVDYYDNDLYFLQEKVIKVADDGTEAVVSWESYNYVKDSIIPYNYSTNILSPKDILVKYNQIEVEIIVRDQFNIGVLGSNVIFSYIGDPSAVLDPLSGYVVTDADGRCSVTFTTGSTYQGSIQFRAKSDKGSTNQGSAFTNCYREVIEYVEFIMAHYLIVQKQLEFTNYFYIQQLTTIEAQLNITSLGKYVFGIGSSTYTSVYNFPMYLIECALVQQVLFPISSPNANAAVEILLQQLKKDGELYVSQLDVKSDTLQVSQMTSSRHINDLNKDNVNINQYVFIQDAIPPFWSEKVTVNTYIWVRLRPFSYSLDPTTLIFLVREINNSVNYDSGFVNVTDLGQASIYDAGGGMFGVDFLYQPEIFFINESTVYIDITIQDIAPIPNVLQFDYWFRIISDYRGPVVYNISPPKESINVALDTSIEFYVTDPGIGLDITGVELFINDSKVNYTYEYIEENTYKIIYDINGLFNYGSTISINVAVTDKSKYSNTTYEFWTISFINSTGPLIDMGNSVPRMCGRGINVRLSDISFQVYAIDGTGVDLSTINTSINGKDFNAGVSLLPVIYHIRKP